MDKMLVLIGKAASGKDSVREILVKKHGFHSIVTYTTRPMREGEIQNITYHYISENDFLQKIESGFFAEWKKYDVNGETWYYGSAKEDLKKADKNTIIILTPEGVRDIRDNDIDPTVIYLYTNLETIKKRLMKRNDTNDKLEDRIKRDTKDFEFAEILAEKTGEEKYKDLMAQMYRGFVKSYGEDWSDNDFNDDINDVVDTIMYFYNLVQ